MFLHQFIYLISLAQYMEHDLNMWRGSIDIERVNWHLFSVVLMTLLWNHVYEVQVKLIYVPGSS